MQKYKWILCFAAACMAVGILMMTPAWIKGDLPEVQIRNGRAAPCRQEAAVSPKLVRQSWEALGAVQSIDIQAGHADVLLIPSDHFAVESAYYSTREAPVSCELKNGRLTIRGTDGDLNEFGNRPRQISLGSGFSFAYGIWGNGSNAGTMEKAYIKLYAPSETIYQDVSISTETGACDLPDLQAGHTQLRCMFGSLSMKNAVLGKTDINMENADADILHLQSESLTIKNSFGRVNLQDAQTGAFSIEAENATLTLEKITAKSFDLGNTFGESKLSDLKIDGPGDLQMENGNCKVTNAFFHALTIKNNYGSTALHKTDLAAGTLNFQAENGDFLCEDVAAGAVRLKNKFGSSRLERFVASGNGNFQFENAGCSMKETSFPSLSILNSYGAIEGTGMVTKQLEISTGTGEIDLAGQFEGDTSLTSEHGTIRLQSTLPSDQFTIQAESDNIRWNGASLADGSLERGNGKNKLNCRSGGDILLTFPDSTAKGSGDIL